MLLLIKSILFLIKYNNQESITLGSITILPSLKTKLYLLPSIYSIWSILNKEDNV